MNKKKKLTALLLCCAMMLPLLPNGMAEESVQPADETVTFFSQNEDAVPADVGENVTAPQDISVEHADPMTADEIIAEENTDIPSEFEKTTVNADGIPEIEEKTNENCGEDFPPKTKFWGESEASENGITLFSSTAEDFAWEISDGTLTISGNGDMPNWGNPVNVPWYSQRSNITSVVIADGITSIGLIAFYNCTSLTDIIIPDSVTSIGDSAFSGCTSLTNITIPDSVTSIGGAAFSYCTSLTGITIPDNVTSIDGYTFRNCTSLTNITIPNNVTSIGICAFSYCTGLTNIVIPDSVTSIGREAFNNCTSLTNITIPDSVTSIGVHAFSGCKSLTNITIPDSVTKIHDYTFSGCTSLTSITIPNSVTSIGICTFSNCASLTNITIPNSVTSIGIYAFYDCTSLTDITIPDSVTAIDEYTFRNCTSLTNITIPNSVTSIGREAFENCTSLTNITIPESVTSIGIYAFYDCTSLTDITISDSVKEIGNSTFRYCTSLTNITIPNSVTSIGISAFYDCTSLTDITIPDSVTSIGVYAFYGCNPDLCMIVYPGSYAEEYAISNNINYKSIYGNGIKLTVYDGENNEITSGYTVKWYEKGSDTVTATGNTLYGADEEKEYEYEIILGEEFGKIYYQPNRQSVVENTASCVLEKIPAVSVRGTVKDNDGKAVANAAVKFVQTSGANEYTSTVTTNSDGEYTAEILNISADIKITADGYYNFTKNVISGRCDETSLNIAEITLTKIPQNKIKMSLTLTKTAENDEEKQSVELTNTNGLVFSLYNKTKNVEISDFDVQYPYIIINSDNVTGNDELIISVEENSEMTAEPVTVKLNEQKMGTADIIFTQNGFFKADVLGNFKKSAFIFDETGKFVSKQIFTNAYFTSDTLSAGKYKAVFMKKTSLMTSISGVKMLDELGLAEETDYIFKEFTIANGTVTNIGTFTVPEFDESKLYYTVSENTGFASNLSSASLGKYITFKAEYKIDDKYTTSNQTVSVEIPKGMDFIENSLSVDGKIAAHSYADGVITVSVNKPQGSVRFYCTAIEKGIYDITAFLSFENEDGKVIQPIGTAHFEGIAAQINAPSETASKNIAITGTAVSNSLVSIIYNGEYVGQTTANKVGSWVYNLELKNTYAYTYHTVYAEMENDRYEGKIKTDTADILYNESYINVSKVTMYNTGDNGENVTVFDFQNPGKGGSYRMWPGRYTSFTFVIEFDGDVSRIEDVVLNVFVNSGNVYGYNAEYDKNKNAWIVQTEFSTFADAPVNVGVEYTCKPEKDFVYAATQHKDAAENNGVFVENLGKWVDNIMDIQIKEDTEEQLVLGYALEIGTENEYSWDVAIKEQDYSSYDISKLEEQGFTLCEADNAGEKPEYFKVEMLNDEIVYTIVDEQNELAYTYTIPFDFSLDTANLQEISLFTDSDPDVIQGASLEFIETYVPYLDLAAAYTDRENLRRLLYNRRENMLKELEEIVQLMTAKCQSTGKSRLSAADLQEFSSRYQSLNALEGNAYNALSSELELYAYKIGNALGWTIATSGIGKLFGNIGKVMVVLKNSKNAKYTKYVFRTKKLRKAVDKVGSDIWDGTVEWLEDEYSDYLDISAAQYYDDIIENYDNLEYNLATKLKSDIVKRYNKCSEDEETDDNGNGDSGNKNSQKGPDKDKTPILDPSGYVCEAVPSNRIEGVTTTVYYEGDELDAFDEPTGKKIPYIWDAEEYDQINPLITDINGEYAWDVPIGSWQVKYEKEGYETAYSEWLPVPPPQTEVHIALKSTTAPKIKSVNAYTTGIRIEFDKYMDIPSVKNDVTVTVGGKTVTGSVEPLNAEVSFNDPNTEYASIFMFVPESEISGDASVNIANAIGYNGKALENAYSDSAAVAYEPKNLEIQENVQVAYGGEQSIELQILPKEAGANKTLRIISSSPSIVSVAADTVTTDENGKATVKVNGNLPGKGEISASIDGTDITVKNMVTVGGVQTSATEICKKVSASIASGTTVEKGTTVTLSTETEGAEIYYTLDKTCPCVVDSSSRIKYTGPITINNDMYIIAYAVKNGYEDSPTASFVYTVSAGAKAAIPTANPQGGSVFSGTAVALSTATENAVIYYTTDGSMPTEKSTVYSTPISVTSAVTIKAIAVKDGMATSDVMTENYTIKSSSGGGGGGGGGSSSKGSSGGSFAPIPNNTVKTNTAAAFGDVKAEDWFFDSVDYVVKNGLMNGVSATEFAPEDNLTRAMLVTILYRAEGKPAVNRSIPFADVTADSYYANAVIWAQQNGIVSGITENKFAPDEKITREQIAAIVYRYAKYKGYDVSKTADISAYADYGKISEYAIESMQYAVGNGLIKGKTATTLNPADTATRAEIAAILQRFIVGNK